MPTVRFAVGIQRVIPWLGYHHVLMMLIAAAWIPISLLLASCTTNTGAAGSIFLLSIQYHDSSQALTPTSSPFGTAAKGGQVTVRSGYLGLCAQNGEQGAWICAGGAFGLNSVLGAREHDPLNAIDMAAHFKDDVVFPGLLIGGVALSALAFLGLATFPGWHEEQNLTTGSDVEIKPFPSRPVSQACMFALGMASLFLLAAAMWQHVAAASAASVISSTSQGYLSGHVGSAAMALAWISFTLIVIVFIAMIVMILSINLLDRLTDD